MVTHLIDLGQGDHGGLRAEMGVTEEDGKGEFEEGELETVGVIVEEILGIVT